MSYCRTTLVEFNSEKDADYSKNVPSEFPEAEILLSTRTGPTSAVVTSVYQDKETAKKATAARNAYLKKAAHRMKSTEMLQGEVILKVVR